jgi:predicted Ser/Thr protein kinase
MRMKSSNEGTGGQPDALTRTGPVLTPTLTAPRLNQPVRTRIGRYEILDELGQGGMAVVYQAYDPGLRRTVALKLIRPELARHVEFVERFANEARAQAKLSHPNVVTIYEVGVVDERQYIAMQFVAGGTLARLVSGANRLSLQAVIPLLEQMADALDYAHQAGVIHRDVKPANILLEQDRRRALLADFGIARAVDARTRLTQSGATIGTAAYMAPEQVTEDEPLGPAADQYALAIVSYELLCGRVPFRATSATGLMYKHVNEAPPRILQFSPELPENIDAIFSRALAKKPADRYPNVKTFVSDVREVLGERPRQNASASGGSGAAGELSETPTPAVAPLVPPASVEPHTGSPKRHRRTLFLSLLGAGLVCVAAVGVFAAGVLSPSPRPGPSVVLTPTPEPTVQVGTPSAPAPTPATPADPLTSVAPALGDAYQRQGVDPKTIHAQIESIDSAQSAAVASVQYPAVQSTTIGGVPVTVRANYIDRWQISRAASGGWTLGQKLDHTFAGGVSVDTAGSLINAILDYDNLEQRAYRLLDANVVSPRATSSIESMVASDIASLRSNGYRQTEVLEHVTICGFTRTSDSAVNVSSNEVWTQQTVNRQNQPVPEQSYSSKQIPQVDSFVYRGGTWLLDGISDGSSDASGCPK